VAVGWGFSRVMGLAAGSDEFCGGACRSAQRVAAEHEAANRDAHHEISGEETFKKEGARAQGRGGLDRVGWETRPMAAPAV
jgi:hypothetical protein